jgi:hypothetical protein
MRTERTSHSYLHCALRTYQRLRNAHRCAQALATKTLRSEAAASHSCAVRRERAFSGVSANAASTAIRTPLG